MTDSEIQRALLSKIGCDDQKGEVLKLDGDKNKKPTESYDRLVRCDGREFVCYRSLGSYDCHETEESSKETLIRIAIDRLSVETACPQNRIALVGQTKWVVGEERVYRLTACGRDYVCVSFKGQTRCGIPLATNDEKQKAATPIKEPRKEVAPIEEAAENPEQ